MSVLKLRAMLLEITEIFTITNFQISEELNSVYLTAINELGGELKVRFQRDPEFEFSAGMMTINYEIARTFSEDDVKLEYERAVRTDPNLFNQIELIVADKNEDEIHRVYFKVARPISSYLLFTEFDYLISKLILAAGALWTWADQRTTHVFELPRQSWQGIARSAFSDKINRVFKFGNNEYAEANLEKLDWDSPGVSSEDPDSIPEEFVQGEFTGTFIGPDGDRIEHPAAIELFVETCAQLFDEHGKRYEDDEDCVWVIDTAFVSVGDLVSYYWTNVTLGQSGYFRNPE